MHADVIQIINEIERRCDTAALTYRGVCYWPLARLRLWTALLRPMAQNTPAGEKVLPNTGPSWPDAGPVSAAPVGPPALGLLRTDAAADFGPTSALFFARPEEYAETTPAGAYAKIIDSVFEGSLARAASRKMELADPKCMAFRRRYPSLHLNLGVAAQGVSFDPPGTLEGFPELARTIAAAAAPALDATALATDMGKIFYFARIFEKLLRVTNPKVLILSVYYHPVGMAWMLASRWTGVKSVDLQHGRLGPVHGLYTHLSAAPADGYHLMPDRIWCWGDETRRAIEDTLNPACTRHRGFVGGNAWLHKWRYGDASMFAPVGLSAFLTAAGARPKILVSLQPYDSPVTPDLLAAMRATPDCLWLLRLHPLRRHTAPHIADQLARAGITNAELEAATGFPLFTLLQHVDHHVTAFSSVTVEAAAFGLATSLIAPEGLGTFPREVAAGIARYTPDTAALVAHVREVLAGRPVIHSDFMDMTEGLPDRALDTLLK